MPAAKKDGTRIDQSDNALLLKIILCALVIRWSYSLLLFVTMGDAGITGVDSSSYISHAENFAEAIEAGQLHGWQWAGNDTLVMPLFKWILALHILVFGHWVALAYVLFQGLVDTATCYLVYHLARVVHPRAAIPAAIAAAINPTQIVMSGLLYTDTPFLLFVALFLLGAALWLTRPSWCAALLTGLGLGGGVLLRPVMAPWVPALAIFLVIVSIIRHDLSLRRLGQIAAALAIFVVCMTPVVLNNVTQYGAWSLTSQSGMHLSRWIVPLVREAKDGTPWALGAAETERLTVERFGPWSDNPFIQSRRYREIAVEELRKLGIGPVIKAWATGAAINLATPAIILSPPVAQLPRTGFYATPGHSMLDKIGNFLFHSDNALYAWIMLIGIAGVGILRLLQLAGIVELLRAGANPWVLLLLAGWCMYILAANGPVASPKYRLPMEPVLAVLTGAGVSLLLRRRSPA